MMNLKTGKQRYVFKKYYTANRLYHDDLNQLTNVREVKPEVEDDCSSVCKSSYCFEGKDQGECGS